MGRMQKRYIINLSEEERASLVELTRRGRVSGLKLQRARILLRADDGLTDEEIADELEVARSTVENVRKRCAFDGIAVALERKKQQRPSRMPKLDGAAEARLVQLACSPPPGGRTRWTLSLLADRLVELKIVDSVSITTVHRRLEKKRAQAVARGTVLHSSRKQRGIRTRDGGCPRRLPSSL
jgi:transposase